MRCAPRWRWPRNRCRISRACRSPAGWSAIRPTTPSATSSACRAAVWITPKAPHAHYVAPRSLLVFDHLTRGVALLHDGSEAERQSLRREVIQALARRRSGHSRAPSGAAYAAFRPPRVPSLPPQAHAEAVRRAQEYIASGDVYQLVLASRFEGRHSLPPFEVYRALRLLNPSPYMYFCELGDITVVGSSPEALVKAHGGRAAIAPDRGIAAARRRPRPAMRNSRPSCSPTRRKTPSTSCSSISRATISGRVATAGSVRVDPFRVIERYSHIMHIVSGVNGTLRARPGCVRPVRGHVPGRHPGGGAEGARDGDHR